MSISPFALTEAEFVQALCSKLGKGEQHAALLYREFYRQGTLEGRVSAFANAGRLLEQMQQSIEGKLLSVVGEQVDESAAKFLLRTPDGLEIETVRIPMQSGATLCVSSQVGCRLGCTFCETGRMGLLRSLSVEEIVQQAFVARHHFGFPFRNVVFMGMGEPFDNYEAVMQAVAVLMDGFKLGKRRITVSTSGRIDGIEHLMREEGETPNLAVSLTAPTDELRNRLMPINRVYDLKVLKEAMQAYTQVTQRQILIAYVMMRGVNDQLPLAEVLADYLTDLSVKVNLIPYNPQTRDRFAPSDPDHMEAFAAILRNRGYMTLYRGTKGQMAKAACGQLGNLSLRKKRFACFNS